MKVAQMVATSWPLSKDQIKIILDEKMLKRMGTKNKYNSFYEETATEAYP